MPKDEYGFSNQIINQEQFKQIILPFFDGRTQVKKRGEKTTDILLKLKIDFTNINGHNLFRIAMKANNKEVTEVLKLYATPQEIKDAEEGMESEIGASSTELPEEMYIPSTPPASHKEFLKAPSTPKSPVNNATSPATPKPIATVESEENELEEAQEIPYISEVLDESNFTGSNIEFIPSTPRETEEPQQCPDSAISIEKVNDVVPEWCNIDLDLPPKSFTVSPEIKEFVGYIVINKPGAEEAWNRLVRERPELLETKFKTVTPEYQAGEHEVEVGGNEKLKVVIDENPAENHLNGLHLAVMFGNPLVTYALLEGGKIVHDAQEHKNGNTALHFAAVGPSVPTISLLPYNNKENSDKQTARDVALTKGSLPVFSAIHEMSKSEITVFDYIKCENNKEVHDFVGAIKREKLCASSLPGGTSTLMSAAKKGNITDFKGVLHVISKDQHRFQELGAVDDNRQNILHYIAKYGTKEMAVIFKTLQPNYFNALIRMEDKYKNLPVHVAAEQNEFKKFKDLYDAFAWEQITHKKGILKKTVTVSESVLSEEEKKLSPLKFYEENHFKDNFVIEVGKESTPTTTPHDPVSIPTTQSDEGTNLVGDTD